MLLWFFCTDYDFYFFPLSLLNTIRTEIFMYIATPSKMQGLPPYERGIPLPVMFAHASLAAGGRIRSGSGGQAMSHSHPPKRLHFEVHLPRECALEHGDCGLGTCLGFPLISEDGRVILSQIWGWGLLWGWQIINNEGFFFCPGFLQPSSLQSLALVFLSEGFQWNDLNSCFVCTLSFKELQWRPRQTVD